jgi:hypothetical protein
MRLLPELVPPAAALPQVLDLHADQQRVLVSGAASRAGSLHDPLRSP